MPDWMSHLLIGLILAELFHIRKKSFVALGALMPDFLVKLHLFFFYFEIKQSFSFNSFHTPVMCFLLAVLIAPLFKHDRFKTIFLMSVGSVTHFLSDFVMRHFDGGVRIFFPASMKSYNFNLIWPEQSIYILTSVFIVYVFIRVVKKVHFEKVKGLKWN